MLLSDNTNSNNQIPAELPLVENFTRLIHCLCALSEGCVYLSSHTPLISHLIQSLTSSEEDDVIRQVVLGALQTLSLTRAVQTQMLSTPDMMTWLLNLLSDPDELSKSASNIHKFPPFPPFMLVWRAGGPDAHSIKKRKINPLNHRQFTNHGV